MKTFKDIISEVAQPKGGDEKAFKAKHVIQKINHPAAEDDQFTGGPSAKKDKSKKASYKEGEDEAVYEETDKEDDMCPECGESYDECECDGEEMKEAKMSDADMKQRENIVMGMKKSKADLQARYGDKWKSVMYATATKKAMEAVELDEAKLDASDFEAMDPPKGIDYDDKNLRKVNWKMYDDKAIRDIVKRAESSADERSPHGPDYQAAGKGYYQNIIKAAKAELKKRGIKEAVELGEISQETLRQYHGKAGADLRAKRDKLEKGTLTMKDVKQGQNRVKGLNRAANKMESVELDEAFKAGEMKLSDGSSVKLTNEDVSALNTLFKELNSANQKKMQDRKSVV